MTLPKFWFGPPPALVDGESFVVHHAANRLQGKRTVGGGLHLTTQRLLFTPTVFDARFGGNAWSCTLAEVVSVGVQRGRFSLRELFRGGLVDRLRIDMADGSRELFVVTNPGQRAAEFREHLQVPPPSAELPAARVIARRDGLT
ncbi:MAG: hypothetical protein AB7O24_04765 [Kofleriaceae bacterium]